MARSSPQPEGSILGLSLFIAAVLLAIAVGAAWAGTERLVMQTTESGLEYQVLREGEGERPAATDTVAVHYEGRLPDGTVFDSSYRTGQPAVFRLNEVIPGWTEGVQLMRPGSKYRLQIPSELAYGARGAGGVIPPNTDLTFDVELLAVAPR